VYIDRLEEYLSGLPRRVLTTDRIGRGRMVTTMDRYEAD
jgi:hypothetical protein